MSQYTPQQIDALFREAHDDALHERDKAPDTARAFVEALESLGVDLDDLETAKMSEAELLEEDYRRYLQGRFKA